jgi:CRISPR/Cas system-associated exonuclease Cas4 (RecB family)
MNSTAVGFRFSQSNIGIFSQCKRRFWLRYLQRVEWPAPITGQLEQWEKAIERGQLFHHWAQQDSLGLAVDEVAQTHGDELLVRWWANMRAQPPQNMPAGQVFSEVQLSVPVGRYRLIAKFDRVIFAADGRVYIIDWKTGRRRPQQQEFAQSWQTLVYRYVMVEVGATLNGGRAVDADQVLLAYWHAQFPDLLQPIAYSLAEHEEAGAVLLAAIDGIAALVGEADFPMTDDLSECRRCSYSALCVRGNERDEDWDIDDDDLDWQEIPEAEL